MRIPPIGPVQIIPNWYVPSPRAKILCGEIRLARSALTEIGDRSYVDRSPIGPVQTIPTWYAPAPRSRSRAEKLDWRNAHLIGNCLMRIPPIGPVSILPNHRTNNPTIELRWFEICANFTAVPNHRKDTSEHPAAVVQRSCKLLRPHQPPQRETRASTIMWLIRLEPPKRTHSYTRPSTLTHTLAHTLTHTHPHPPHARTHTYHAHARTHTDERTHPHTTTGAREHTHTHTLRKLSRASAPVSADMLLARAVCFCPSTER